MLHFLLAAGYVSCVLSLVCSTYLGCHPVKNQVASKSWLLDLRPSTVDLGSEMINNRSQPEINITKRSFVDV